MRQWREINCLSEIAVCMCMYMCVCEGGKIEMIVSGAVS